MDWNNLLWTVVQAAIVAALGVLTPLAVRYLRAIVVYWTARAAENGYLYELQEIAGIVVLAAEQIYGAGAGEEKFNYAMGAAQEYLDSIGIEVYVSTIRAAIEAAVKKELNTPK